MKAGDNIVLIGMAGVGKSTVGVLLAKKLSRSFVDTDILIQTAEGRSLQEIIDQEGVPAFRDIEERSTLGLECDNSVIATGGSIVYSPEAMAYLKTIGNIVFLHVSLKELLRRVTDMESRGIVMEPGETFESLYTARLPLYQQYAEETIDCHGLNHEAVVGAIIERLGLEVSEEA